MALGSNTAAQPPAAPASGPTSVRWAVVVAAWAALALGDAVLGWVHLLPMGARPIDAAQPFFASLVRWGSWGALTPAVLWVVRRVPLPGPGRWRWLAPLAIAGLAAAGVHSLAASLLEEVAPPALRDVPPAVPFGRHLALRGSLELGSNLAVFGVVAGVFYLVGHLDEQRAREVRVSRLETRIVEAELAALETQLHPHFLFNALNAVSALVDSDPAAAERALGALGDLLRLTLARRGEHLTILAEEVALTTKYLELQRLRHGDRLQVTVDLDPEAETVPVPRLVLQGLVENAIKHGGGHGGPLAVAVRCRLRDGALAIAVDDDGSAPAAERDGGGLGLDNLRARLELLYGSRFDLRHGPRAPHGFSVDLELPADGGEAAAG